MSKFLKGLLFGGTVAGIATLLTVKQSGVKNRQEVTQRLHHIKESTEQLQASVQLLNQTKEQLVADVVPELTGFLKEATTAIRQFSEENHPRLKRIKKKVDIIQNHIKS